MLCFVNDTATTEIYTYRHTLSLHDALPILRAAAIRSARRSAGVSSLSGPPLSVTHSTPRYRSIGPIRRARLARRTARQPRSEEHTSELQSLMRISYAVLCLNKNTKKYIQHNHIQ